MGAYQAGKSQLGSFVKEGFETLNKTYIVDMGEFGHLMDFCSFWTRELHVKQFLILWAGYLKTTFSNIVLQKIWILDQCGNVRNLFKICYFFGF